MHAVQRIFRMPLPELLCRSKQETFKLMERIRPGASDAVTHRHGNLNRFTRNAERRFFIGPFDSRLAEALPSAERDNLIASADEILRGHFNLLGYHGLNLGEQPDWHRDPISNRRAPLRHWSRINPLNPAVVGDSKVVWELNRHQWLVNLGQAYVLTGHERYAEAAVRHIEEWIAANPRGLGINWTSSLEVALRLIAWCWTLLLVRDSEELTANVFADIFASAEDHAIHIERYLSYYFSPNTHLTGEALGLVYAAVLFPDMSRARRWGSLGFDILVEQIERQVLFDGIYFERSSGYQRYTVDIYLHFLVLMRRAGTEVPPVVTEKVRSMLDALVALRQPDGSMPNIGDADGGSLLPLSRSRPNDFAATFSTAAVVGDDPVYAWAAGRVSPETMWLLGSSAKEEFAAIKSSPPSGDPCRIFPTGGFAVMRNGWDHDGHALIFDTGALGCPNSGAHGHADLLSIQCAAFGQNYLVDPGTYCYTADSERRNYFRSSTAHSTLTIDGRSQSEPSGPFSWRQRPSAQLLRWISDDVLAFADAEHDAYSTETERITHRRRVIFVKPSYWIVIDDLTGSRFHDVALRFQFAPSEVQIDSGEWVRARRDGTCGVMLRVFSSVSMKTSVREGCEAPMEGWISPDYGQLQPAPVVVYQSAARLPIRLVTVAWPALNISTPAPYIEVTRDQDQRPVSVSFPERAETVRFEGDIPCVTRFVHTATLAPEGALCAE